MLIPYTQEKTKYAINQAKYYTVQVACMHPTDMSGIRVALMFD